MIYGSLLPWNTENLKFEPTPPKWFDSGGIRPVKLMINGTEVTGAFKYRKFDSGGTTRNPRYLPIVDLLIKT